MNRQPEVRGQKSEVRGREEMNNHTFFRLWRSICNPFAMGGSAWGAQSAMLGVLLAVGLLAGIPTRAYGQGASGGDSVFFSNPYWVHTFSNSANFIVTSAIVNVEYLIVAGGGGGVRSSSTGGGGGGGGVRAGVTNLAVNTTNAVTVGGGGGGSSGGAKAANGGTSSFVGVTNSGGGGGGGAISSGQPGGCGGGGGTNTVAATGVEGQGFKGGIALGNYAGGGGGAGAQGGDGVGTTSGSGGSGTNSWITGAEVWYGGGGGGAGGTAGAGGKGGGAPGGTAAGLNNGTNGLGGGGGGRTGSGSGGNGGSGIVIIRYTLPPPTVTLNMPTNNQSFARTASILASGTVANASSPKVTFWTNSTAITGPYGQAGGELMAPPYTNLLGVLPVNTYHIYARIVDGSTTNYSATNTFFVKAAPSVTVSAPTNGQSYTALEAGGISVTGVVSDGVGPFTVAFYTNVSTETSGALAGTDSDGAPYTLTLGPLGAGASYLIYAVVTDQGNGGETATSETNVFSVQGATLAVTMDAPAGGAEFPFDASIAATATVYDATGSYTVKFWTNATGQVGVTGTDVNPYGTTFGPLAAGSYTIYATVDAGNGSATSATRTITVLAAPTVTLAALATPYEYGASITATATCANGKSPYSVQFYTNSTLAGTYGPAGSADTSAPYTATFGSSLSPGTYYIYAEITDNYSDTARTVTNSFTVVDTIGPTVTGVTASPTNVSDQTVGVQTFAVTVTFSEAMKTSVTPSLTFAPAVGTTLSGLVGGWPNSTTYTARYDVADANTTAANVTIDVENAQDASGNGQQNYTPEAEFSIDTANPTVTGVSVNDSLLEFGDQGAGKFVVTVTFSEAMTNGTAPTLTFLPAVGSALSGSGGGWSNSITYTGRYDVAASATNVNDVTIRVTGAKDAIGNTNVIYTSGSKFSIAASGQGADGGTVTQDGKYWIHTFSASGQFNVIDRITDVEYLIVAAGGNGGRNKDGGGGGGGGGVKSNVGGTPLTLVLNQAYSVVVGAPGISQTSGAGDSGGDSSFIGGVISITSTGGGGGGGTTTSGKNGGSGGGGGTSIGIGSPGQGFDGGAYYLATRCGGGGGAGALGGSATSTTSGSGGSGTNSWITGAEVWYGGGGGGAGGTAGGGGTGGGAAGGSTPNNAPNNRGGGGGGVQSGSGGGGLGGSGVVIIRYLVYQPQGTLILVR